MSVDRSQLRRMIDRMENALSIMEAQQAAHPDALDDGCDRDDDPVQFGDPRRYAPVAEPSDLLMDSPPARIHNAPKTDLFS